jgi:hypothetical protein
MIRRRMQQVLGIDDMKAGYIYTVLAEVRMHSRPRAETKQKTSL